MTPTRSRTPYFQVPPSQQPLRVRERALRKPRPKTEFYINPLEQLIVVPRRYPLRATEEAGLGVDDGLEAFDAANECSHGRLPHDRTPPCGCWPQEPAPVPELIPGWVLADARDLHASGMTYRKIATAILPVTDCPDVPSCEETLKLRLEAASRPQPEPRRTPGRTGSRREG